MWRIQGLVGRVLSRCNGNGPLRLSNSHYVEDEVISSSTVLCTGHQVSDSSSQSEEKWEKRKKRKTSQFCYATLPRYTALDAVGWGAAAVLFLQLCSRIHSQLSSLREPSTSPPRPSQPRPLVACTYRVLLDVLSRRNVLPAGGSVMCLKGAPVSAEKGDGSTHSTSSSSSVHNYSGSTSAELTVDLQPGHTTSHQQGETFSYSPTEETVTNVQIPGPATAGSKHPQEENLLSLEEAAHNLRTTADNSVPIILNIIGLESANAGDHVTAFECFLASAKQGYSKAQFNVGVCYESGRGVHKDFTKALLYYRCAASAGHTQAQYRCAKLLLDNRGQQSVTDADISTALSLLRNAAAAGLTEAQLYLGVLLAMDDDSGQFVQYFRMAAESGDSRGLLFLAQCYERGFGVGQCCSTAVGLYQQASAKGNEQAKNALRDLQSKEVLRSIRSAPCLSILDHLHWTTMFPQVFQEAEPDAKDQPHWSTQPLLHSHSTGSIIAPPPCFAETPNSNGKTSGWIIGMG